MENSPEAAQALLEWIGGAGLICAAIFSVLLVKMIYTEIKEGPIAPHIVAAFGIVNAVLYGFSSYLLFFS